MAKQLDYPSHLLTAKSASFFTKHKPMSRALVERILHAAMKHASGNAICRQVHEDVTVNATVVRYSFVLFKEESEPAFMDNTTLRNVDHCFLLICELPATIAIFKSHAPFNASSLELSGSLPGHGDLSRLFMESNAAYEKLGMRMMNISRDGILARSLESPDLTRSMSTIGMNRAIPTGMRIKKNEDVHTITPNTGRVSKRDVRGGIIDLITWALQIETEFARPKPVDGFIDQFAKPMKLSQRPAGVEPAGVMFTLEEIEAGIADQSYRRIVRRRKSGAFQELTTDELKKLFNAVRDFFQIGSTGGSHWIYRTVMRPRVELKINKNTITMSNRLLRRFFAEKMNGEVAPVTALINKSQDFLVTFNNPQYAYFGGQLYQDQNLLNQIDGLLSIFIPEQQLAAVTSEKGTLAAATVQFPLDSIFGVVHQTIAAGDQMLVCDDLGDEWADGIGVCTDSGNPSVSFYVAKHEDIGLSASNFHDAVGQAQKNLGHMNPVSADLVSKINKWDQLYNGATGPTQIHRVLKGANAGAAVAAIQSVLGLPNTRRRMCLVISFISKGQLSAALTQLKNTGAGSSQLIQLIWLVTAFISSCRDANAVPTIYCAP